MQARLEPDEYGAWFRNELGRRVWRDERRALDLAMGDVAGRTVLDVGAGDGRLTRELADRRARVIAVDRVVAVTVLCFADRPNEMLREMARVAASAGSACHADEVRLSPVLQAMGVDPVWGMGTVRLSVGRYTTEDEVDEAASVIAAAVADVRNVSEPAEGGPRA